MDGVKATMEELARRFPPGLKYKIALDRTEFVREAIREVVHTLFERSSSSSSSPTCSCRTGGRR